MEASSRVEIEVQGCFAMATDALKGSAFSGPTEPATIFQNITLAILENQGWYFACLECRV